MELFLQVLVIGGGVAGLAAVGQAKSMGAIVRCRDRQNLVAQNFHHLDLVNIQLKFLTIFLAIHLTKLLI